MWFGKIDSDGLIATVEMSPRVYGSSELALHARWLKVVVKVLTLTERIFSLYYRILIQGGETHPLIFIVGTNNFIEYLQSY